MAQQPILYTAVPCNFCQRVKIALSAKGVEFEPIEIDLVRRPAWFRAKASGGSVPLLETDEGAFHGSALINEYLEERYPRFGNLVPRDVASRNAKEVCDEGFGVGPTGAGVCGQSSTGLEKKRFGY